MGIIDVPFLSVEIRMHPGILLGITTLDYPVCCVPVTFGVMPLARESAAKAGGGRSIVEAGAKGFEGACGHGRGK